MSCLNLNKLLPARKAWRGFTNRVQIKLNKLRPSKTIKKPPKTKPAKIGKRSSCWPAFCIHIKVQPKRFKRKPSQPHSYHSYSYYLQKKSSAVYIDQLFIEPAVSLAKELLQPPIIAAAAANKGSTKEIYPSISRVKKPEIVDPPENVAGTSKDDGKLIENMHAADDMWESLVLASPQMNRINERAEEFITRFRAEMRLQGQLARHL